MKVTVLDTKTGLKAVIDGLRSWDWTDGNYSCDCNRNPWNVDTGKEIGICEGSDRFIVVEAEMNDPDDYKCTLAELNSDYPDELLRKYGIEIKNETASPETCEQIIAKLRDIIE